MAQDVHAAPVRHADIEDQKLPRLLAQPLERLLARARLADLADRGVLAQELAQACPDDGVIVRYQDSCCHDGGFMVLKDNPYFGISGGRAAIRIFLCRM
jgi:hypothetical protein